MMIQRFQTINRLTRPILFIPTIPHIWLNQAQREGNPKSQPYLSIHPKKPKEEDSIGVLTIPYDLCKKKTRKAEQKN